MRCPRCNIGVRLELRSEEAYQIQNPQSDGINGLEVTQGLCPECGQLIVALSYGPYRVIDENGELINKIKSEIIYPKIIVRSSDPAIPLIYREMFNEAYSVLPVSPKASAALSRRLLQLLLREEFHVKKANLIQEIAEFITGDNIPGSIKEEIDAVRHVGNIAAHPNKYEHTGEIVDVEPGEAEWLLDIIEHLFEFKFIIPAHDQERKRKLNEKLTMMNKPSMK